MLTRRTKTYSSFCSQTVSLSPVISSQFIRKVCAAAEDHRNQSNPLFWKLRVFQSHRCWYNWKDLRGYRSLMPSCASFLEPKKSSLGPSNNVQCWKFCALLLRVYLKWFGAIRSWNVSRLQSRASVLWLLISD